ncbi:hypothetical protein [Noviherbaspirillum denitrificans]|uniref:Uncharacterized protein n=1 Tax=Noviherbaspirillum denitrificans TaxID=1968433 RepID=A0A254T7S1_9BURK|nr:hypothetical protein [Noviherbaspirillum denitrificans]OWW18689.1 hypothetical protein AYR66_03695 [Noviherbaspirillum denitrificans]
MKTLVTEEMLDAAVRKAVEAGLLPRHACRDDAHGYQELIRFVLQAALDAQPRSQVVRRPDARNAVRERFSEARDITHWLRDAIPG